MFEQSVTAFSQRHHESKPYIETRLTRFTKKPVESSFRLQLRSVLCGHGHEKKMSTSFQDYTIELWHCETYRFVTEAGKKLRYFVMTLLMSTFSKWLRQEGKASVVRTNLYLAHSSRTAYMVERAAWLPCAAFSLESDTAPLLVTSDKNSIAEMPGPCPMILLRSWQCSEK
jgi:hypothetical protein